MHPHESSQSRWSASHSLRRALTLASLATLLFSSFIAQAAPSDPFGAAADSFTPPPGEIVDFNVGDWGVSQQRGAATYTFPIDAPPGRNGMAPSLVLRYSSQAPLRGGVAAGWTLDIPTIEKDLSLGADAGVQYRVTMPQVSGRLVEVPDDLPYADAAAAYRVDFDTSFTRFFRRTQQVEFKTYSYWMALSPDGVRHYFENDKQASDRRSRWMLTRQEDAFGNTIQYFYSYVKSPLSDAKVIDYRLDRIEYTSNAGAGLAAHAKVELEYAPLEVCSSSGIPIGAAPIRGSSQVSGAQRLTTIKTYVRDTPNANWRLSRTTALTIKLGASVLHEAVTLPDPPPDIFCTQNPLRYLERIDVTAFDRQGAATTLPPVRFFYNKRVNTTRPLTPLEPDPMAAHNVAVGGPFQTGDVHGAQTTLLDLNSDGLRDQVRVEERNGTCTLLWRKGLPGGAFAAVEKASPLPTVPWYNGGERAQNEYCTLNGQIAYHKGRIVGTKGIVGYHFVDYTGDGRLDLVTSVWATGDHNTYTPPNLLPGAQSRAAHAIDGIPIPDPGQISSVPMSPEKTTAGNPYVWRVYRNAGDPDAILPGGDLANLMFSAVSFTVDAPLPLAPTTSEAKIDVSVIPNFSVPPLIDIDGDGFLDMVNPRRDPDDPSVKHVLLGASDWTVFFGDGSSAFPALADSVEWTVPRFSLSIPGNGLDEEQDSTTCKGVTYVRRKMTIAALDDFNGDGLPDLIVNGDDSLIHPYPSTGSGFAFAAGFTPRLPLEIQQTDCTGNVTGDGSFLDGLRGYNRRMIDLDGDGLRDVVFLSGKANTIGDDDVVFARFNLGDRYGPQVSLPAAWLPVRRLLSAHNGDWGIASDFTDVTGDGLADLVEWNQSDMRVIDSPGLRPASDLLTAVENGRGLRVEFDYAPSTDGQTVRCSDTACSNHTLPYVTWVVSTTRADPGSGAITTEYTYFDAQFLSRSAYTGILERANFAGFARVEQTVRDANGVARQRTRSHYQHQALSRQGTVVAAPDGRLQEQFTYLVEGDQARLHSYKRSGFEHRTLFGGQVQVTLPISTTSCVAETPGGSVDDCLARTSHVVHTESTWAPRAPSTVNDPPVVCNDPPCDGPPPELFVQTETLERSGDGALVRRTRLAYDIRYGQPWPPCNEPLCTQPPNPAPDDYRVQVRETVRAVLGSDGQFQTVSRSTVVYDKATGLPQRSRDYLDASTFAETAFEHDPTTGNLLSVRKPMQAPSQGGSGAKTQYTYGPHKLFVAQTTDELGFDVFTDYDVATGVLISRRGPNARPKPNGKGEKLEEQRWTLDGFGRVLSHSATFDEVQDGQLRYRLQEIVRYTYEDRNFFDTGAPVAKVEERLRDVGGSVFVKNRRTYDGLGRVLQSIQTIDANRESVITYEYDAQGNLARVIMPDPRDDTQTVAFTYTYDGLNRPVRATRPDGNGVSYAYTGQSRTVREETGDGSGGSRTEIFDAFGRLIELQEHVPGAPDAVTRYSYDANDNLARIVDADGNVTDFEHNQVGNRVTIARTGRTWRYVYDLNGNLVQTISPRPAGAAEEDYTVRNTYDDLDRLVMVQFTDLHLSQAPTPTPTPISTPAPTVTPTPTGSGSNQIFLPFVSRSSSSRTGSVGQIDPSMPHLASRFDVAAAVSAIRYIYDQGDNGLGRLARVELPFGQVRYGYDPQGHITLEERSVAIAGSVPLSATQTVTRSYNALGQLLLSTWDDGQQWGMGYDSRGLVERVEWFDPQANQMRRVAGYSRNALGLPSQRTTDYGQTRTFTYDVLSRVVGDQIAANGQPVAAHSYAFNDAGDLVQVGGQTNGVSGAATYTYDAQHRLLTASGPNGYTAAFAYSPAGNVLSANVAWNGSPESRNVGYEYGQTDPQAVERLVNNTGGVFAAFDYAPGGYMTWRRTPEGDALFHWDGLEQIRLVETPNGSETYYYDHTGARMLAVNANTGARFWFGESETHYDVSGGQTERYLHLAAGGPTLARIRNGSAVELQYADALQNLMLALDGAGNVAARFFYGAFGEVVDESGTADHRRQFNGKESDAVSGLRYYGYRYYDPLLLRWNSADPLYRFAPDISLQDPQRINLYTFSLNNPVRYYDPDGREADDLDDPETTDEPLDAGCVVLEGGSQDECVPVDEGETLDEDKADDLGTVLGELEEERLDRKEKDDALKGEARAARFELDTAVAILGRDTKKLRKAMKELKGLKKKLSQSQATTASSIAQAGLSAGKSCAASLGYGCAFAVVRGVVSSGISVYKTGQLRDQVEQKSQDVQLYKRLTQEASQAAGHAIGKLIEIVQQGDR